MFSKLKSNFLKNPSLFYAMSIAATWANAGSLLNGITMARGSGIVPYLLWAIGNTLACIVFGIFAPAIPKLREVFRSKAMKIVMGVMCPFQCWISMNGIQTVFADTVLGARWGIGIALAFAVFFVILLYKFGMIRNVLTDHMSWTAVYVIVFGLTLVAMATSPDGLVSLSCGMENIGTGVKNCVLLIPGAFLYPYYFELLDYNDSNEDGAAKINVRRAFVGGGLIFGFYLVFIFLMSMTTFGPALNIVKAVLVTLIAVSSLSSFQYSIYLTFGRGLGLALNAATVALWQLLIPLGVMGAWTLMASIRIYIVAAAIAAALVWHFADRRKAVSV
ncbi:MAG: hypothetical protein IKB82_08315 [Clostridia bacterium]|nr:hypothetical protein [Clostridia bacterium]